MKSLRGSKYCYANTNITIILANLLIHKWENNKW